MNVKHMFCENVFKKQQTQLIENKCLFYQSFKIL